MVADSLSHGEPAGFTPEGSPLTKANMVADLWGHGAASPARSGPEQPSALAYSAFPRHASLLPCCSCSLHAEDAEVEAAPCI